MTPNFEQLRLVDSIHDDNRKNIKGVLGIVISKNNRINFRTLLPELGKRAKLKAVAHVFFYKK